MDEILTGTNDLVASDARLSEVHKAGQQVLLCYNVLQYVCACVVYRSYYNEMFALPFSKHWIPSVLHACQTRDCSLLGPQAPCSATPSQRRYLRASTFSTAGQQQWTSTQTQGAHWIVVLRMCACMPVLTCVFHPFHSFCYDVNFKGTVCD